MVLLDLINRQAWVKHGKTPQNCHIFSNTRLYHVTEQPNSRIIPQGRRQGRCGPISAERNGTPPGCISVRRPHKASATRSCWAWHPSGQVRGTADVAMGGKTAGDHWLMGIQLIQLIYLAKYSNIIYKIDGFQERIGRIKVRLLSNKWHPWPMVWP